MLEGTSNADCFVSDIFNAGSKSVEVNFERDLNGRAVYGELRVLDRIENATSNAVCDFVYFVKFVGFYDEASGIAVTDLTGFSEQSSHILVGNDGKKRVDDLSDDSVEVLLNVTAGLNCGIEHSLETVFLEESGNAGIFGSVFADSEVELFKFLRFVLDGLAVEFCFAKATCWSTIALNTSSRLV